MTPKVIKASDLKLGDVIRTVPSEEAYLHGTVKQIKEDTVVIFRPYVQTADFSYTGGVICYIGIEIYEIWKGLDVYLIKEGGELR